jgi:hypothetical protein
MFRRTILTLAVAALTLTGVAAAQENATFVMRSGDRVAGQLMDLGGVGFTVRINGQERQIPANDIAAIDFTGGPPTVADWAKLRDERHVIVLRSGQAVSGQLYDVSGSNPLKITFRTETGEREFSSGEISQILLARPASGPGSGAVGSGGSAATPPQEPPPLAPATGTGVLVPGNRQWTPTRIGVRKGELWNLSTTGEIQLSADPNDIAGPAGSKQQRYAAASPLPRAFAGALIGRIGPYGAPFGIGDLSNLQMPETGELYLGINDDQVADNRGDFRVDLHVARRGR